MDERLRCSGWGSRSSRWWWWWPRNQTLYSEEKKIQKFVTEQIKNFCCHNNNTGRLRSIEKNVALQFVLSITVIKTEIWNLSQDNPPPPCSSVHMLPYSLCNIIGILRFINEKNIPLFYIFLNTNIMANMPGKILEIINGSANNVIILFIHVLHVCISI